VKAPHRLGPKGPPGLSTSTEKLTTGAPPLSLHHPARAGRPPAGTRRTTSRAPAGISSALATRRPATLAFTR
jgi:hypothetical protein